MKDWLLSEGVTLVGMEATGVYWKPVFYVLEDSIDAQVRPFRRRIELLVTIPGMNTRAAEVVLAEIGADITRFPSAADLASWAGVYPGNHESAGKRSTGKTRHGDPWLKGALDQAAGAAARSKQAYLSARYRRIASHRGKKRALVALQHSILIAVWHMFTNNVEYHDLGPEHFLERTGKARQTRRLVGQLNRLGYQVALQPAEAACPARTRVLRRAIKCRMPRSRTGRR